MAGLVQWWELSHRVKVTVSKQPLCICGGKTYFGLSLLDPTHVRDTRSALYQEESQSKNSTKWDIHPWVYCWLKRNFNHCGSATIPQFMGSAGRIPTTWCCWYPLVVFLLFRKVLCKVSVWVDVLRVNLIQIVWGPVRFMSNPCGLDGIEWD